MLFAAAVVFVAVLLVYINSRAEKVATHDPTPSPTRVPLDIAVLKNRQWSLALPELRRSFPEKSVVVVRRSPLRGSLENPASSSCVYVFVRGDGQIVDISQNARDGDLLEHDGIVKIFGPTFT